MKKWIKSLIFVFLLMMISIRYDVIAATSNDINSDSMFFKQNTSTTCTLSSAAMLVRRTALMNGNPNWSQITEANMRATAWTTGGLRNSFSYEGINISTGALFSSKTQTVINLLVQHPEGIVIYDRDSPHAILLTDYTNGIFYCADPSSAAPAGRIPISQATITVEGADKYWYVASPKVSLNVEKPSVGSVHIDSEDGKVHYYCSVSGAGASTANVNIVTDTGISKNYTLAIENGGISGYLYWTDFTSGMDAVYTITVSITDIFGNTASNTASIDTKAEISTSPKSVTLKVGESYQLSSFVKGAIHINEAKWSTWHDGIAVSDDGLVMALLPGEYTACFSVNYTRYNEGTELGTGQIVICSLYSAVKVELASPEIQNLTADTKGNIRLNIQEVPAAGGYQIEGRKYIDGLQCETMLDDIEAGKSVQIYSGNEDGSEWRYRIRAYRTVGEETFYSDWSSESLIKAINLNTDICSSDNEKAGEITISWRTVESAEGYLVYRSMGANGMDEKLLSIVERGVTSYTDASVEGGNTYVYRVVPYLGVEFGETKEPAIVTARMNDMNNQDDAMPPTNHTHQYASVLTRATLEKDGEFAKQCSCGDKKVIVRISQIKTVDISNVSCIYNGKSRYPSVTVKDSSGAVIDAGSYTVSYGSNKNVGQGTVTVTFIGNYEGSITKTFTIVPKGSSLSKVTAGKKGFTVKWKKQSSQTSGYEIQYSTSSKFTKKTTGTTTIKKTGTTSANVKKLKAKKKYYVRIRTYKTVKVNGKNTKVYSEWSKSKSIRTK